jgi:hypothetical protein
VTFWKCTILWIRWLTTAKQWKSEWNWVQAIHLQVQEKTWNGWSFWGNVLSLWEKAGSMLSIWAFTWDRKICISRPHPRNISSTGRAIRPKSLRARKRTNSLRKSGADSQIFTACDSL